MATITSTWELDGLVEEQRYYRSTSPIDTQNPPTPTAILENTDRAYTDTVPARTKQYIAISSVKNGEERFSDIKLVGDPYWSNVIFYSRLNGSGLDRSTSNRTPSYGSSVTYSAGMFNQGLSCSGGAQHCISYPSHSIGFDAGEDFTIECIVKNTIKPTELWFSPLGSWSSNLGFCFFFTPTGMVFHMGTVSLGASISYSINTNYYLMVEQKSNVVTLYVNGNPIASVTHSAAITSKPLFIGGNGTTTDYWWGIVDEIRITKGVARYNGANTIPLKEFYDF